MFFVAFSLSKDRTPQTHFLLWQRLWRAERSLCFLGGSKNSYWLGCMLTKKAQFKAVFGGWPRDIRRGSWTEEQMVCRLNGVTWGTCFSCWTRLFGFCWIQNIKLWPLFCFQTDDCSSPSVFKQMIVTRQLGAEGRLLAPQGCPCLILGIVDMLAHIAEGNWAPNGTKETNQLTLIYEGYLGLPRWVPCNHKGPKIKCGRGRESQSYVAWRQTRRSLKALRMERPRAMDCQWPREAEKGRKTDHPLELPEGIRQCQHIWVNPVRAMLDLWSPASICVALSYRICDQFF